MSIALVIISMFIGIPAAFIQFRQNEKKFLKAICLPRTYFEGLKSLIPFSLMSFSFMMGSSALLSKNAPIEIIGFSFIGLLAFPILFSCQYTLHFIAKKYGRLAYWTVPAILIVVFSFYTDGQEGAAWATQFLFYGTAFITSGNLAYYFFKQDKPKMEATLLYAICLVPILFPLFFIPNTIFQPPLNDLEEGLGTGFLWFYVSMFIIGLLGSFIIRKTNKRLS